MRDSLAGRPLRSAVEAERWSGQTGVVDVLGPATLAYLDEQEFRPATGDVHIARLPPGIPDLDRLVADVSENDVAESGIPATAAVARTPEAARRLGFQELGDQVSIRIAAHHIGGNGDGNRPDRGRP